MAQVEKLQDSFPKLSFLSPDFFSVNFSINCEAFPQIPVRKYEDPLDFFLLFGMFSQENI